MPPAVIAAAIVGTGAVASAAIGSSAAKKAATASQDAANTSAAVQNKALDLQQQNTATQRAVGDSALNELASRFGLSTPTAQQSNAGTVQGAATGGYDWDGYLKANSDVADYYNQNKDALTSAGFSTPEAYAQWHYENIGKNDGHIAPTQTAPATVNTSTNAGLVDENGNYTVARPTVGAAPTFQAPTLGAAPTYQAPTLRETAVAPLDVSLSNYEQSPDYQFQLEQGSSNVLNNAAVHGTLQSGAALKALQSFGQNLALGDYSQWRDYATNQYNTDRSNTQGRDDAANSFATTQANNQYAAANNAYQYAGNYAANNALNTYNAANGAYQYGNNLAQTNYNSDRDYTTGQYNANTNALLSLAGQGASATGATNSAIGSNANALTSIYTNNANTQGNASLANAGLVNSTLGTGVNALAYYYGNQGASTPATTSTNQYYNY